MTALDWISAFIADQGMEMPPELHKMIQKGVQDQGPVYLSTNQEEREDSERMNKMFPSHQVVAFGRLLGSDGVISLVVADGAYPKGAVLVLHWDGWPGTEVDEEYPSLAAWAKAAEADIAYWDSVNPKG